MKKLLTLSILALAISTLGQVPTNGLVASYDFSGNANDLSGNGNNGVVNGATLVTDRNGNLNSAYSFNGTTSYIEVPHSNSLLFSTNAISVSFWAKVVSVNSSGYNNIILSKQSGSGASQSGFNVFENTSLTMGLSIKSNGLAGGGTNVSSVSSNTYHHFTFTYDNGIATSYLDGALIGSYSGQTGVIGANTMSLLIGKANWSNINAPNFNGIIDELQIYNRALTSNEVTTLFTGCTNPIATITPQSSTTFCSGNSVLLNATTANGYTYEWYKNSVLIPSASSSSYSVNQSGSYTVKIYNGACNTTSSATNVTVNPNPTASINTSGSTTFCQGGFVTLTASGGGTYQWNNSSVSASINATTGGTYSVIVTNNGCTSTASQLVTVNSNPLVSLTSLASYINNHAPSIQLSGTPSGGTYSGPGVVGSNFNPSTAGLGVKNITYNYTNVNGCVGNASTSTLVYDTTGVVCTSYITVYDTISVTDTLYITTTLGLQNNASNTFKVYPNPAKDHITIDNGNYSLMNGYSIKIENVIGQTVFTSSINAASFYLDLSSWTGNGVYLLHIKNSQGNDVEVRKIVLQH
jgi:hypothetical protein